MIIVQEADWTKSEADISSVRHRVFVEEQKVSPSIEMDGKDPACNHVLATIDGVPVGTGRLLPDGHIGRIAVLKSYRHRGIGELLVIKLIEMAKSKGMQQIILASQLQAMPFYRKLGFIEYGDIFQEAGIPHQHMKKTIG